MRSVVPWEDLRPLMCGTAHAVDIDADDQETRLASGPRHLGVMLQGAVFLQQSALRPGAVAMRHPGGPAVPGHEDGLPCATSGGRPVLGVGRWDLPVWPGDS